MPTNQATMPDDAGAVRFSSQASFGATAADVGRGNLLPGQAVVQYAATLAIWLGVSATDLATVVPGAENFNPDLGFMNAS